MYALTQNKQSCICTPLFLQPEDPDALRMCITVFLLFFVHTTTRGRFVLTYCLLCNFTFPCSGSCLLFKLVAHLDHGVDV